MKKAQQLNLISKLIGQWEDVSECVKRELECAKSLLEKEFITESGLRLGRAAEACLYDVANQLNASTPNKTISELKVIRELLSQCEVKIIRNQSYETIIELSKLNKKLAEAIGLLVEDEKLRAGIDNDTPKSISAIFSGILSSDISSSEKSILGPLKEITQKELFNYRNKCAHPSVDLSERELSKSDYDQMLNKCHDLLNALLAIKIGAMAAP